MRVTYKNTNNLVQNNETDLASGSADAPVTFTVPEDSKLVFFYFGGEQGATLNEAAYTGAKDGSVKLGYKLLPAFIADRIQDLTANGNVVQRGVYRQDAIKLWKTSPVIGRGLGGFENGVVSVQDYYYETKYAHNHYVEVAVRPRYSRSGGLPVDARHLDLGARQEPQGEAAYRHAARRVRASDVRSGCQRRYLVGRLLRYRRSSRCSHL